jgi:heme/copper-type cytochrome/quinol oxidase subunit 2
MTMPPLRSLLLFWLSDQPDQNPNNMTYTAWTAFLDSIAAQMLICIVVFVIISVVGYAVHARRLRITYPDQYFATFTPLRWPWLVALTPAVIILWRFVADYRTTFPVTSVSPLMAALQASVFTLFLSWLVARLLVMLPGITPRKFRYRPLWFVPKARLTRAVETP